MLREMTFLAGAGVGYVLGARAGRERYERIKALAKSTAGRPELQQAVAKAAPLAGKVKTMAYEKIPGIRAGQGDATATATASATAGSADPPADAAAGGPSGGGPSDGGAAARGHGGSTSGTPILVTPAGMDEGSGASHEASNLPPRGTFSPTLGIF